MKKLLFFFMFLCETSGAQDDLETLYKIHHYDSINLDILSKRPMNYPGFDKPGNYELVPLMETTTINPGDTVDIRIYITGYGLISGCKVVASPSSQFFEHDNSWAKFAMNMDEVHKPFWGSKSTPIPNEGVLVFTLSGSGMYDKRPNKYWPKPNLFFDTPGDDSTSLKIVSEELMTNPPMLFHISTKKDIRPGDHFLSLYMTYFNGEIWKSSSQTIHFKVTTRIERNEDLVWILGIIGTVVALLAPLIRILKKIWELLGTFLEYKKKILRRHVGS